MHMTTDKAPLTWWQTSDPKVVMGIRIDGAYLLSELRKLPMSQVELAREIGISKQHINDLIHDRRGPSPQVVRSIAKVLNVPPRKLLFDAVSAVSSADMLDGAA